MSTIKFKKNVVLTQNSIASLDPRPDGINVNGVLYIDDTVNIKNDQHDMYLSATLDNHGITLQYNKTGGVTTPAINLGGTASDNRSVELLHDGSVKLITTANGIDVGGTVNANVITIDGNSLDTIFLGINDTAVNSALLGNNDSAFYLDASNLNSGTVPPAQFDNISHGDRAGGTLHATATQSVNGFLSAADKTKIDTIAPGATPDQTIQAGDGLQGGGTGDTVAMTVGAGDGITVQTNTVGVDTTVVRTSGTQSIEGSKSFNDRMVLSNSIRPEIAYIAGASRQFTAKVDTSTNTFIQEWSDTSGANVATAAKSTNSGAFELYYNGSKKLATSNTGVNIAGDAIVSGDVSERGALLSNTYAPLAYPSFTGYVEVNRGSGSVALTTNDGYGNANVAFNHRSGIPDVDGSSARIESAVDVATGSLVFEVGDNTVAGDAVGLNTILTLSTSAAAFGVPITVAGGSSTSWNTAYGWGNHASAGYLLATSKAADSQLLDGVDGAGYLRSNTDDVFAGGILSVYNDSGDVIDASGSKHSLQVFQPTTSKDAFMTFHVASDFATYFGIRGSDNRLVVGGWSHGANTYPIYHEGYKPTPAAIGAATSAHTHTNYITSNATDTVSGHTGWQDNYQIRLGSGADLRMHHNGTHNYFDMYAGNLYFRDSTTTRFTFARTTGALTATGDITAFSDERLKTDWATLDDDFIENLAKTKVGTYTRIDTGERQVGVSAQALETFLPEAVLTAEDEDGTKSVAYGNAALAACVELAKEVKYLRDKIERLEKKI